MRGLICLLALLSTMSAVLAADPVPDRYMHSSTDNFGASGAGYSQGSNVWHCGWDILCPEGTPVKSIADGIVVASSPGGWDDQGRHENYGLLIQHQLVTGEKFVVIYGHLKRAWNTPAHRLLTDDEVRAHRVGLTVSEGEVIGKIGAYGTPHLHIAVYFDPDSPGSFPSSGYGRQPLPRPQAADYGGVISYGCWRSPRQWMSRGVPRTSLGGGTAPGTYAGQEIVGPAGIPLVWVPGGSFMMGSEDGYSDEQPVHEVTLTGFWIGKTEVTVAQWRSVMGSVPNGQQGDDHPVVGVSWNACSEFCNEAGLQLPTEAQWEYAARGPQSGEYPWGDTWDGNRLCWAENRGPGGLTFAVGSFPTGASWVGALDMAGNVWEWCADWYAADYYDWSPTTDPTGPSSGVYRVLRAGSWSDYAGVCRSAYRYRDAPDLTYSSYGFRVARSCR